jgi:hypothetical protein
MLYIHDHKCENTHHTCSHEAIGSGFCAHRQSPPAAEKYPATCQVYEVQEGMAGEAGSIHSCCESVVFQFHSAAHLCSGLGLALAIRSTTGSTQYPSDQHLYTSSSSTHWMVRYIGHNQCIKKHRGYIPVVYMTRHSMSKPNNVTPLCSSLLQALSTSCTIQVDTDNEKGVHSRVATIIARGRGRALHISCGVSYWRRRVHLEGPDIVKQRAETMSH